MEETVPHRWFPFPLHLYGDGHLAFSKESGLIAAKRDKVCKRESTDERERGVLSLGSDSIRAPNIPIVQSYFKWVFVQKITLELLFSVCKL